MTKVRFYTDVAAPKELIVQLVQQALDKARRVTVYVADIAAAQALSARLWQAPGQQFLAHALATDLEASVSPVLLAWHPDHITQDDMLFNCQPTQLLFFGRFRHLFEIISNDEAEKQAGRQRYAFYRDRGYEIQHMKQAQSLVDR